MAWVGQGKIARAVDLDKARALPLSFILGAVIPVVIGMAPTWFGPKVRTAEAHQIILAAWQADPLWVSWILNCTAHAGAWIRGRKVAGTADDDRRKAYWWVRASYLLAASSSAMGHLYVVGRTLRSSNREAVNFVRMYVPLLSPIIAGPAGTNLNNNNNIFVRGPWLFLQYDLIIISLSSLSWAFLLLLRQQQTPPRGQHLSRSINLLGLILLAGSLTIGPGATVSLALFVREGQLPEEHYYYYNAPNEAKKKKKKEK